MKDYLEAQPAGGEESGNSDGLQEHVSSFANVLENQLCWILSAIVRVLGLQWALHDEGPTGEKPSAANQITEPQDEMALALVRWLLGSPCWTTYEADSSKILEHTKNAVLGNQLPAIRRPISMWARYFMVCSTCSS